MSTEIRARDASFFRDLITVAGRGLRSIPRDPEGAIPPLIIGAFFYIVNIAALSPTAEAAQGADFDFKAFQLPTAIIFSITGVSRASTLVLDISGGYFDRLLATPVSRLALLLGLMVADFTLAVVLCIPVIVLALILGVSFATGIAGMAAFLLFAGLWGLAFTGFLYAVALRTGSPAAVNSGFLLFFPFAFLTTTFLPKELLTSELATISEWNPVTYVLEGLRSLVQVGWDASSLLSALAAIAIVGVISMSLALAALRGRVSRG